MTTLSTYGHALVNGITNKSGGGVVLGDVVILDTANDNAFTTTTSASTTAIVGVAQETIANNATGRVQFGGYTALVNVNASVTRGHYGVTHTVAKQAADGGASRTTGTFVFFETGGTTPAGWVFNPDLSGAALTNPMTTKGDIIQGDTGGTPTRLGAGTSGQALVSGGAAAFSAWGAVTVPTSFVRQTTSVYTLNSTTEADIDTGTDLTIAAATSDKLQISLTSRFGAEAVNAFLDVATIVSAAPVNYVSGGAGDSDDFGVGGWLGLSGVGQAFGGTVFYTVQSGDISGGNVVLRLRYRTSAASNKTLNGGAGSTTREALFFGVVNLKH